MGWQVTQTCSNHDGSICNSHYKIGFEIRLPPTFEREPNSSGRALSGGVERGRTFGLHYLRRDAALVERTTDDFERRYIISQVAEISPVVGRYVEEGGVRDWSTGATKRKAHR